MNCLSSTFKYALYLLNIIFVAGGVLLIVVGSIILSDMGSFKNVDEAVNTETIPILIIILGSIVFVVSFFGCCGTIRENACCTSIYAIMMFVLFCLQVALTIWLFVERKEFLDAMGDIVKTSWKENDQSKGYPMDALQITFKCCGLNSFADYNGTVPSSCCGYSNRTEVCSSSIYSQRPGCQHEFVDFWAKNIDIVRWSGIAIAIFELVIVLISCCLAGQMRSR